MHSHLAIALKIAIMAMVATGSLCKTPESIAKSFAKPVNFESELRTLQKDLNTAYSQVFDIPPSAETQGRPLLMFNNIDQARGARQPLITHFGPRVYEEIPALIKKYKLGDLLTKIAHKYAQTHQKLYDALSGYYNIIINNQSYDETMRRGDNKAKDVRTSVLNVLKQALELSPRPSSQKKATLSQSVLDSFMDLARESTPLRNPKLFTGFIVLDKEKQKKQQKAQQFLIEIIDKLQQALQKTNTALINALSSPSILQIPQREPEKAPAGAIKPTEPAPKPQILPKIPVSPKPATQEEQELISLADNIEILKKDLFHLTRYLDTGNLNEFDRYYTFITRQGKHKKTMEHYKKLEKQLHDAQDTQSQTLYKQYIQPVASFLHNYEHELQQLKQKAEHARQLKTKPKEPAPKPQQIDQPKQSPSPASSLPEIPISPTPVTEKEFISLADSIGTLKKDLFHLTEYLNTGDLKQFDQYYALITRQGKHEKTMEHYDKLEKQLYDAQDIQYQTFYKQYIQPVAPFIHNYKHELEQLKQKADHARQLKMSLSNNNTRMRKEAGLIGKGPVNKQLESSYRHWLEGVRVSMDRAATIEREKYLVPIYEQFFAQVKQIEEAKSKK